MLPDPVFDPVTVPLLHELRVSVPFSAVVSIKCISGLAEIAGRELPESSVIDLPPGTRCAIASFQGCDLLVSRPRLRPKLLSTATADVGAATTVTTTSHDASLSSSESEPAEPSFNMGLAAAANLHAALEQVRASAAAGPRVLISGPADSGKSTLAKTLCNYALKLQRQPLLVDLNPENPTISIPGSMAVQPITYPCDASLGLATGHPAIMANGIGSVPLLFWYGADTLVDRPLAPLVASSETAAAAEATVDQERWEQYLRVATAVATAVDEKLASDHTSRTAGIIVDVPGDLPADLDYLIHMADTSDPAKPIPPAPQLGMTPVHVLPFPRNPGAVAKDRVYRRYRSLHLIREYFYGAGPELPGKALTPHNIFAPTNIFWIGKPTKSVVPPVAPVVASEAEDGKVEETVPDTPAAAEPSGVPEWHMETLGPTDSMVHSVLPVLTLGAKADRTDVDKVAAANVVGFVYVSAYDKARDKYNLLVPFPGHLPRTTLGAGSIKWFELS
ncbi:hypothetical protein BC828DRAFT_409311 [Blastocladiella britannica]|nr:hypothetical protein BC828DRAFT_409311 [Blastocladiella britannica]